MQANTYVKIIVLIFPADIIKHGKEILEMLIAMIYLEALQDLIQKRQSYWQDPHVLVN